MAREKKSYVCNNCGTVSIKWLGQCPDCQAWESFQEKIIKSLPPLGTGVSNKFQRRHITATKLLPLKGESQHHTRFASGLTELDRVLGGGIVPASAILIGGDPGIGKSTLLLQAMAKLSEQFPVAYISGEESIDQIRLRAKRLGIADAAVGLAINDDAHEIAQLMSMPDGPKILVADSVQTLYAPEIDAAPGSIQQVRAASQLLIRAAKTYGVALFLVGHVTKDGSIAGPRLLEHMVDTVLYFEGERSSYYRLLRCYKNRFGSAEEIGVFDMTAQGLIEVANPSYLFMSDGMGAGEKSGSAIFAAMEGTRPLLIEIEALVAPSSLAYPRRTSLGFDQNRLAMILAILETRAKMKLARQDVFLNITGGFSTKEPGADLAVAAAIMSSQFHRPLPQQTLLLGELGLSGDIRPVSKTIPRIKSASQMGLQQIWLAESSYRQKEINEFKNSHIQWQPLKQIDQLIKMF